jgi:hypothetical protein
MNKVNQTCIVIAAIIGLVIDGLSLAAVPKTDNAALVYYQALMFVDDMTEEAQDLLQNPRHLNAYKDDRDTRGLVSGKGRWAIQYATIASRMPNCDWGLMPEQSPIRKWGPDELIWDLGRMIRLDVKFSVTEDPFAAMERCNTLRRFARQLEKEHQVLFMTTGLMEKMGLDGLIYMAQALPDDTEMLHWLERQVAEFCELSLVRFSKHRCDDVVRNCLTRDEARIMLEQDGHDPNEEPYRSTLSLTDEEWVRFRTDPYVEYTNDIIDLLQQDLGYEQTLTKIISLNDCYHSEAADHWAIYYDDGREIRRHGQYYAGSIQTKSQVNVLKTAIKLYLIVLDTGQVPDVLPPGMAKDPHTGRDFIYERTPGGFLLRCQAGKNYSKLRHEFVFKVGLNNETNNDGIQSDPRSNIQGPSQEVQVKHQNKQVKHQNIFIPLVEASLFEWFECGLSRPNRSGIVRIFSDILSESDKINIPGVQVVLGPACIIQLEELNQDQRPDGHLIHIKKCEISGDKAFLFFHALTEGRPDMIFYVNCYLKRSDSGWIVDDIAIGL